MVTAGVPPDNFAFPAVLKATAGIQDLNLGKQLHAHVFKFGQALPTAVPNSLVNMYGKAVTLTPHAACSMKFPTETM
ncbi:pentatricopeptide repeat-containing protein chloroplastic-like, partial [Trifolium medium]|nr:pentatricopeptide repeat-containing protein chloroplastic-like [Trifolium medium]